MSENLVGVLFTLLLIFACFALAFLVSGKNAEIARKIVHIGVAHWYFIYIYYFTDPIPALAGLAAFAVINGILNLTGGLSALIGQKSLERNWGLVWYPISFFLLVVLLACGVGNRAALGCAMLGMGWGDGLAALIGRKFGKRRVAGEKTWLGFCTLLAVVTVICLIFTGDPALAIAAAITAAILEVLTPFGLDNISVPLGIYAVAAILSDHTDVLDGLVFGLPWTWTLAVLAIFFALLALLSVRMKFLTESGAMAAFLLGLSVTSAFRFRGLLLLLLFFVSSNAIGKLRVRYCKTEDSVREQKSAQRDHVQVAANGFLSALAAVLWLLFQDASSLIVFGAVIAEATADTWAGELGRISRRTPVSIRTGKPVACGISGGVTPLGFAGGFAGSAMIALCWLAFFPGYGLLSAVLICITGFAGCVLDSLLGDGCQALYMDPASGRYSEAPLSEHGSPLELVRGRCWLDNDMVNFLSNAASSIIAWVLYRFLI